MSLRALLVSLLVVSSGCVGATRAVRAAADRGDVAGALRAYRVFVEDRGEGDPDVLALIARAALREAASSDDPGRRSAGFAAIRGLGTRAVPMLTELAAREGVVGDRAAAALWELQGPNDERRARLRRALASRDQERRLAGMTVFSRGRGRGRLLRLSADADARVRAEAIRRLARGRCTARVLARLSEVVDHDEAPEVRFAAVQALGACGDGAVEPLGRALRDAQTFVRMGVPSSLLSAAPEQARETLRAMLQGEPDPLSVEAARALAQRGDSEVDPWLLAVMRDAPRALRVQAAVAAQALARRRADALRGLLRDEEGEVVLRVAAALGRLDDYRDEARAALRPLASSPDAFIAIRAVAALASMGEPGLATAIRGALRAPDPTVRRLAVLAWPDVDDESDEADALAPLLRDPDRSVALLAAVQIILVAAR